MDFEKRTIIDGETVINKELLEYMEDGIVEAIDIANNKADKSEIYKHTAFGTCDTAKATAEKVIVIDDENWKLEVGSLITVRFSATNSASNVTLNVNNTGAYGIRASNSSPYTGSSSTYCGYANRAYTYMFDGSYWQWISSGVYPSATTNVSLGQGYATCSTEATTIAKTVSLSSYALAIGGIVAIKFTYDVPASATLNINSRGAKAIYHKGVAIADGVIKAGDTATFIYSTQYHLISIDRDETFSGDYNDLTNAPTIPTKTSELTNDSGFLTNIPSEYVTETELNEKGYLTEHQDLSNYALESEIPTKTSQLTNDSNYLTSIPSEYVTDSELNEKGYLTEHQDLSDYAKTVDIPTKTSELTNDIGLVSGTDLENRLTLGYDEDGKLYIFYDGVSIGTGIEISGVEISAVTGVIDEDNNIILSGNLANGTYTIKYQYEDGTFSDAITVSVGDVEVYKNLLPEAQEEGLTGVYNGVGYKENLRWSGTNQDFVSATQCVLTGLIPIGNEGDVFHIRGVDMVGYVDGRQSGWSHFYDSEGNRLQMAVNIVSTVIGTDTNGDFTITMDSSLYAIPTGAAYIRFQLGKINGDFTISRNFLIP